MGLYTFSPGQVLTAAEMNAIQNSTPGVILGVASYNPAAPGVTYSTTLGSFEVVDGTNLAVAFKAPSSGQVLFSFEAFMGGTSASDPLLTVWDVTGAAEYDSVLRVIPSEFGSSQAFRGRYSAVVGGLTSGTTYTFGPGFASSSASNSVSIYVGNSPTSPPYGPGVVIVTAV